MAKRAAPKRPPTRVEAAARWLRRAIVVGGLVALVYGAHRMPAPRATIEARTGPVLTDVRGWGYQLQNAEPTRMAAALDLLVIDSQNPREPHRTLSSATVERFRTRPDGSRRIVLAYLSVGEAESYRYYWWPHWSVLKPGWLGRENPQWQRNFRVRYWESGWQGILVEPQRSFLGGLFELVSETRKPFIDRIIEAGFDGVYLDRVDAFYEWTKSRPTAEADMVALVAKLSQYARARRPGFLIVPQNAEELLRLPAYRRLVDGVAKEDLYFGTQGSGVENKAEDVAASTALLARARADRLPVFVVEYSAEPSVRERAVARARDQGFVVHFADRELAKPPEAPPTTGTPKG